MSEVNCSLDGTDRLWAHENVCGEMPISFVLVLTESSFWVLFFAISFVRLVYLSRAALGDTLVSKKMQFVQAWFYAFFHTLIDMITLFTVGSLVLDHFFITAIAIIAVYTFTLLYSSQIDVIGTVKKTQGVNAPDVMVMIQYFFTIYLAKSTWKLIAHKETGADRNENAGRSKISKICCWGEVDNSFSPRVYDFKDIVGIQGAFLGLPALFVLLLTQVRSEGIDSFEYTEFVFNPLLTLSSLMFLISALSAPLLGDWETYHKSKLKCILSFALRFVELLARIGFYTFFLDQTRFQGFIVVVFEFLFMWFTSVKVAGSSSAGRTGGFSHQFLASWESMFFMNYRRVHVDKDFVQQNLTLMPLTIELIRWVEKVVVTIVGYIVIAARKQVPLSYTEAEEELRSLPLLFFGGIVANFVLLLFGLVYFIAERKKLSGKDLGKIKSYWMSMDCYSKICCCCISEAHVNRDNVNFQAGGNPIHYI